MSIYRCNECDEMKDKDYNVCVADPRNDLELLCEDCACELGIEDDTAERFAAFVKAMHVEPVDDDYDPTPYCHVCDVMEAKDCTCTYARNH